jgi:hypothetical protein
VSTHGKNFLSFHANTTSMTFFAHLLPARITVSCLFFCWQLLAANRTVTHTKRATHMHTHTHFSPQKEEKSENINANKAHEKVYFNNFVSVCVRMESFSACSLFWYANARQSFPLQAFHVTHLKRFSLFSTVFVCLY